MLGQPISIPGDALQANLTFAWYMQSIEWIPADYDFLYIRLRDTGGNLLTTLGTLSNQSPRETWQTATFDLLSCRGQLLQLSLETDLDSSNPTSFFVDNVSLWICRP